MFRRSYSEFLQFYCTLVQVTIHTGLERGRTPPSSSQTPLTPDPPNPTPLDSEISPDPDPKATDPGPWPRPLTPDLLTPDPPDPRTPWPQNPLTPGPLTPEPEPGLPHHVDTKRGLKSTKSEQSLSLPCLIHVCMVFQLRFHQKANYRKLLPNASDLPFDVVTHQLQINANADALE